MFSDYKCSAGLAETSFTTSLSIMLVSTSSPTDWRRLSPENFKTQILRSINASSTAFKINPDLFPGRPSTFPLTTKTIPSLLAPLSQHFSTSSPICGAANYQLYLNKRSRILSASPRLGYRTYWALKLKS